MGKVEEIKPTIRGRLELEPVDRAWLLLLMRNFKDAVEYAHSLIRKDVSEAEIVRLLTSRVLNNSHYSYSALQRAKLYENQPYLKLRKPQLFSVGKECEKGNRNIKFESTDKVKIKIPSAAGRHRWIVANTRFGEKYLPMIEELIDSEISYGAGIYLKEERIELHINVPITLYVNFGSSVAQVGGSHTTGHIASFDFNPDRVCMVIVNRQGEILDVKNRHFHEVSLHGFPRGRARGLRLKALTDLVDYAHNHGVTDYVAEYLSRPDKKTRSKSGNRKISKFALREYITHLKTLILRYGGKLHLINPAYTFIDAIPLSERLGLDIHTASAYLLAIRALKSMNVSQRL